MAGLEFRISDLAGADPLGGTEVVPLVQNGTTKIRAVQDIVSEGGLQAHIDASDPHPQYAFRIKNNLTATTDPTINNDSSEGYTVTSKWVNTATTEVWMCLDDTAGNARWETATLSLNDLGALALANNASDVDYDNTSSGLPTNVQGAIDQLDSTLDTHVGSTDGHPVATQTNDGFLSSTDKTKLDGIEQGATADQTKAEIDALGINADQVDGFHAGDLLQVANNLSDVQDATTSFNNIKRNASESYYGVVRQASTQEAQNGTAGAFPDAQGVKESYNRILPGGTDLNTITQSGFYRLQAGNTNAPLGANYSQLLVIHGGGDTITQIVSNYDNGDLFTRSGNPPDVGGTGSWSSWEKLLTESDLGSSYATSKMLGEEFAVADHQVGVPIPSNSGTAKFIKLTAGESGAGGYNEGLLINETITGSGPTIEITAEIATGPLAGEIIHLWNSENRYPAPGETSGAVADDQMQRITGEIGELVIRNEVTSGALSSKLVANARQAGGSPGSYNTSFDSANSPNARTGDHTNVKHEQRTWYKRIA